MLIVIERILNWQCTISFKTYMKWLCWHSFTIALRGIDLEKLSKYILFDFRKSAVEQFKEQMHNNFFKCLCVFQNFKKTSSKETQSRNQFSKTFLPNYKSCTYLRTHLLKTCQWENTLKRCCI